MGLGKWWMTHGPGSVGSVARTMAKDYTKVKAQNQTAAEEEILSKVLFNRMIAHQTVGSSTLNQIDPLELIEESEAKLTKLIFLVLQLENPTVSQVMLTAPRTFFTMLEIINEVVAEHAPNAK